jgi:hypothetical protein
MSRRPPALPSRKAEYTSHEDDDDEDDEVTEEEDDEDEREYDEDDDDAKRIEEIDGDDLDIVAVLDNYECKDAAIAEACKTIAAMAYDEKTTGPLQSLAPDSQQVYIIDRCTTSAEIGAFNGNRTWKQCLDDTTKRCYLPRFPYKSHAETVVHSMLLKFAPPSGDFVDLRREAREMTKSGGHSLVFTAAARKALKRALGDTVKQNNKDYHLKVRSISIVSVKWPLPISVKARLLTFDPVQKQLKNWCNVSHGLCCASGASTASGFVIPAMSTTATVADVIWTAPLHHMEADYSRWVNVGYDRLKSRLEKTCLQTSKVKIGHCMYSIYRIPVPSLFTETSTNDIETFLLWSRYADIRLRTQALPGVEKASEWEPFVAYKDDKDTGTTYYTVVKVVFDSLVDEYMQYMSQGDSLMSIGGDIRLTLECARDAEVAMRDITAYETAFASNSSSGGCVGSYEITLQVEYETFRSTMPILQAVPKPSESGSGSGVLAKKKKNKTSALEQNKKNKVTKQQLQQQQQQRVTTTSSRQSYIEEEQKRLTGQSRSVRVEWNQG